MMLVEERHRNEEIAEVFMKRLTSVLQKRKESLCNFKNNEAFTDYRNIEDAQVLLLTYENEMLEELVNIYLEYVSKIQHITEIRGDRMSKIFDNLKKEKQIWEKTISQQLEILQVAER